MRGCLLLEAEGGLVPFARAAFAAYWGEDKDISQDAVLEEICRRARHRSRPVLRRHRGAGDQGPAARQHRGADRRGGFGTPTLFVDGDDMYFGNDRLPLLREKLRGR